MHNTGAKYRDWVGQLGKFNFFYFVKNSPPLFISNLISSAFAFLLTYVFTRYATQEIYGQYQYIFSILGVLSFFSLPGVNTAVTQSSARGFDSVLQEGTKLRLKSALMGGTALILIASYSFLRGNLELSVGLVIAAVLFPTYYGLDTFLSFLKGKQQFLPFSVIRSLLFSLPALATIIVVLLNCDLRYVVMTKLGITSLLNLIFLQFTRVRYVKNSRIDRGAMNYGKHTSMIGVLGAFHYNLSSLVIGTFLGFEDLAVFSIGDLIRRELQNVIGVYYTQISPKLAAKSDRDAFHTLVRSSKYTISALALLCLFIVLALPIAIPLLFTVEYADSILYAQLLVIGSLIAFPGGQFVVFMAARKKVVQRYKVQLSFTFVEVIALLLLAQPFGVLGIVLAKITANLWYSCYSWWLSSRSVLNES
jgi:O-antigen/teichoic acid export membrane protein